MNLKLSPQSRLFKYHPVRFPLLRNDPLWVDTIETANVQIAEDRNWAMIGIAERIAMQHLHSCTLLKSHEEALFQSSRISSALGDEGQAGAEEMAFMDWHANGEQIFDLSQIAALFLQSDASDVPINSIQLPFDGFYIYWGSHLRIDSPDSNRYIDGCYVTRSVTDTEGSFDLAFTTGLPPEYRWDQHSLLANLVVDAEGFMSCIGWNDTGTFRAIGEAVGNDNIYPVEATRWTPFLPSALSMVANCLCYLSWENREIVETYPPEAPARLVAQTKSAKQTERRRGMSKLNSLGFRLVRLCGDRLAESVGLSEGSTEVPPHWRKGHWRAQRVGAGRTAIKVVWIHATVVNGDKGQPLQGHLYKP